MKHKTVFSLSLMLLAGCAGRRMRIDVGAYSFVYRGQEYTIESVTPNFVEGYNVLLGKEGRHIVLRAVDKEQDGVVDEVIRGKVTLKQANTIYAEGLRLGKLRGHIRKRIFTRSYHMQIGFKPVSLATYILALGETYNKFIVAVSSVEEVIVVDSDADGTLDVMEAGSGDAVDYQELYETVIAKGKRIGRIVETEGMVVVMQ